MTWKLHSAASSLSNALKQTALLNRLRCKLNACVHGRELLMLVGMGIIASYGTQFWCRSAQSTGRCPQCPAWCPGSEITPELSQSCAAAWPVCLQIQSITGELQDLGLPTGCCVSCFVWIGFSSSLRLSSAFLAQTGSAPFLTLLM